MDGFNNSNSNRFSIEELNDSPSNNRQILPEIYNPRSTQQVYTPRQ